MINKPQCLVSLIRGFLIMELFSLFVFTLLYNFAKVKTLIFTYKFSLAVSLFLALLSFSYKYPAFYILGQLGYAPLGYLFSALFIFIIGNVRLGLESQPLSFSYDKFIFSLLLLLIVAIFNYTGFISNIQGILFSSLGSAFAGCSISLSSEVKDILTFKPLKLV